MSVSGELTRILGLDPGLNTTGYGVVDLSAAGEFQVVEAGVLRGGRSTREIGARLRSLHQGLSDLVAELQPHVVALEELYSHYDRPRTAILMGHARGVLCLAAAQADLQVHDYSATQIKRILTGNGRAPKTQVQAAIARHLDLDQIPEPSDVADALAVALCHGYLNEMKTHTS